MGLGSAHNPGGSAVSGHATAARASPCDSAVGHGTNVTAWRPSFDYCPCAVRTGTERFSPVAFESELCDCVPQSCRPCSGDQRHGSQSRRRAKAALATAQRGTPLESLTSQPRRRSVAHSFCGHVAHFTNNAFSPRRHDCPSLMKDPLCACRHLPSLP